MRCNAALTSLHQPALSAAAVQHTTYSWQRCNMDWRGGGRSRVRGCPCSAPEAFRCRRALRSSLSFRAAAAFVLSCGWAALRRAAAVVFGDVKRSALCLRGMGVSEALCACVACARSSVRPTLLLGVCACMCVCVWVQVFVCACVQVLPRRPRRARRQGAHVCVVRRRCAPRPRPRAGLKPRPIPSTARHASVRAVHCVRPCAHCTALPAQCVDAAT